MTSLARSRGRDVIDFIVIRRGRSVLWLCFCFFAFFFFFRPLLCKCDDIIRCRAKVYYYSVHGKCRENKNIYFLKRYAVENFWKKKKKHCAETTRVILLCRRCSCCYALPDASIRNIVSCSSDVNPSTCIADMSDWKSSPSYLPSISQLPPWFR